MARIARYRHPEPISAINVTPFIDVLLVLLIMIVLTIPIATQKLPIDLPQNPTRELVLEKPHTLAIDRQGALFWDGRSIGDAELPRLLATVSTTPEEVLHFQTDPEARYERFNQVLGAVKRAGVTRLGFVGNRPLED
jgi:biopolymer transport protein ExbD